MSTQKLSLSNAVLINLNIMLGTGIFINTVELSKRAGLLGGFTYLLVGLLILPLIIAIMKLVQIHPSGGFFVFGKTISPLVGYISTWTYFTAKLASATLMIHVAVALITQIFPFLLTFGSVFIFDLSILTLFISLNLLNMKTGGQIQLGFLSLKLLPLFFVILIGLIFFSPAQAITLPIIWEGIPSSLPLALFAIMGFEAICSISNKIENASHNAPKAIIISCTILLTLVFLFQFFFYTTMGAVLTNQSSFLGAFPALLTKVFGNNVLFNNKLQALFHLAIASSALGGCYGILYSNAWNLYILANNKIILGSKLFTRVNSYGIPYVCLFTQGVICIVYLITTGGNQVILQQLAAFGTSIAFTISVIALLCSKKSENENRLLPALALLSCLILLSACIKNFIVVSILPLIGFILLLIIGLLFYNKKNA